MLDEDRVREMKRRAERVAAARAAIDPDLPLGMGGRWMAEPLDEFRSVVNEADDPSGRYAVFETATATVVHFAVAAKNEPCDADVLALVESHEELRAEVDRLRIVLVTASIDLGRAEANHEVDAVYAMLHNAVAISTEKSP